MLRGVQNRALTYGTTLAVAIAFPLLGGDANGAPRAGLSTISVPVMVNLKAVEERLNQELPIALMTIDEPGGTCVEAQWLKTKGLPKCTFEGFEFYCEDTWLKTKTTPEVSCDLKGWIRRDGPITVTGAGDQISVSIPIRSEVTAIGRGEIGKNIKQTVRSATIVTATATADITPDWQPALNISADYRWTEKPTFKLFNLIPVTIAGKVEPELNKHLDKFRSSVPQMLAEAKLKERVSKAWQTIQQPVEVDKQNALYVQFSPSAVGFSGVRVDNGIARATFMIAGQPQVSIGAMPPPIRPVALPPLTKDMPKQASLSVSLPIAATYEKLGSLASQNLVNHGPIDLRNHGYAGSLRVSDLAVSPNGKAIDIVATFAIKRDEGLLSNLDYFGWFSPKGRVRFSAEAAVDSPKNVLYLKSLTYRSSTNSAPADWIVTAANLPVIGDTIRRSLVYNFSPEVASARALIGKEMTRELAKDVSSKGQIQTIAIGSPSVGASAITVPVSVAGSFEIVVGM